MSPWWILAAVVGAWVTAGVVLGFGMARAAAVAERHETDHWDNAGEAL